jgi:spermidine/putrescine-binding protein
MVRQVSRRGFLKVAGLTAAVGVLAACGEDAAPAAAPAPAPAAAPAAAPAPAAAAAAAPAAKPAAAAAAPAAAPAAVAKPAAEVAPTQKFKGVKIVLGTWDSYMDVHREAFLDDFEASTGAKVSLSPGNTGAGIAKVRATASNPELDVMMWDANGAVATGRQGLIEVVDLARIENLGQLHPRFLPSEWAVPFGAYMQAAMHQTTKGKALKGYQDWWGAALKNAYAHPEWSVSPIVKWVIAGAYAHGETEYAISENTWNAMGYLKVEQAHHMITNNEITAELFKTGEVLAAFSSPERWRKFLVQGYPMEMDLYGEQGYFAEGVVNSLVLGHKTPSELLYTFVNKSILPKAQLAYANANFWIPMSPEVKPTGIAAKNTPVGLEGLSKAVFSNLDFTASMRVPWVEKLKRMTSTESDAYDTSTRLA